MQCPFCMEEVGSTEVDRLAHVLSEHSTRLAMAHAVIRTMGSEGVWFESDNTRKGYREWLEDREKVQAADSGGN